ncbi:DNA helicase-2/ATP-dependent DNA helicase PcrA [Micromonospora sp. A200]|uniref:ATP-dependent helicase n=1 Tax=Micromonospora sp. A200 TaxID=2940568 RepID=UPI0024749BA2|nr:ATP-dependent DNA helicase [Micromonospora sp. A200]MDH6462751.1 DNA helicase-2/ATP-dependent DNA helicase PcrA [Micromonospora sp. A200]
MTSYTEAQKEAIVCLDEPLQIIACAGSGKTQVISQRIAAILAQPGVAPRNLIAFTFTEKAAAELKERILSILKKEGLDTLGLAEMYVGTMHGYALDLLQRLVPETFKFSVLTEITSRMFVDRNSRKSGLTICPTLSSGTPHLRRFLHSRLFLQATSVLREDTVDWDLVPGGVVASFEDYMKLLYAHAYFDFTEMIHLAVQFLEGDVDEDESAGVVQQHIRDDIRYVVVDEYQDVNPLQERLVRGLTQFGANLCVVGDDDQTIYQWRGSEVSNIVTFKDRYEGVRQVTLAENFRSSEGVVEVGRSVAERIPDAHRLPKAMVRAGHQRWQRGDMIAREFADENDEAAWICDRIEAMRGLAFQDTADAEARGLSWSDFAVLYRSVANDAGPLVEEMRRREIPYVVKGLNRLFDSPEIQAVVGVFRYMAGLMDASDLRDLWADAKLLPSTGDWDGAMAVLDEGRDFDRGKRWGVYNIQRLYLEFMEALGLREETLPGQPVRRELVFYQLGKFSQAISDFEQIYFNTAPKQKYETFAAWLEHQAPGYYAESDADVGYAMPDAVTLTTVHQAKGMQWPAVFLPCLRANRFPAKRQGGLGLFHIIPQTAVADADRYRGTLDDETRLFYVAVTRAQKYLFVSFSPGRSQLYRRRSAFFDHCAAQQWFSTRDSGVATDTARLEPRARHETPNVTLSFSELKYLFECPYQFKLRFLYGFNPPLHEALGYGKGLHDALAEVHKRAITGDLVGQEAAGDLVTRHLHTPYAYPELKATLHRAAVKAVERYLKDHESDLERTVHSEKQIQVHVAPGITVDGRIDLVRRLDTDELAIVDFKSTARAQDEDVTRDQLHVYAVGYEELTGNRADLIEVLNLDEEGKTIREEVEDPLLVRVRARIKEAGDSLRDNHLPRLPVWSEHCGKCDLAELCRDVPVHAKRDRRAATGR